MFFPTTYKVLRQQEFSLDNYKIVPIRYEDRLNIMRWRNEQIFHLRQKKLLTEEQQNKYFTEVVAKLFEEEYPEQILFSYLKNGQCIGYGGLVHIDWYSKNAEISFIIDPSLEEGFFNLHWKNFLQLLYKSAFIELNLHKVYTYAFDIRPHLYEALEGGGLVFEARLKEHFLFNGEYKDVVTHYKLNPIFLEQKKYYLREADIKDATILFYWTNETSVRNNSLNSEPILWEHHLEWFENKLASNSTHIYILHNSKIEYPLGLIRLDYVDKENGWYISYSIDKLYRGKKLGTTLLNLVEQKHKDYTLLAKVKFNNIASINTFRKANFEESLDKGSDCFHYIKKTE